MRRRCVHIFVLIVVMVALCIGTMLSQREVQARSPQLTLSITHASATDYKAGSVSVHTLANAALTITVLYLCSNRKATSGSLQGVEHADRAGNYTWTWKPNTICGGDDARVIVTAQEYGQTRQVSKLFHVK